jgi:hypothetical protein
VRNTQREKDNLVFYLITSFNLIDTSFRHFPFETDGSRWSAFRDALAMAILLVSISIKEILFIKIIFKMEF